MRFLKTLLVLVVFVAVASAQGSLENASSNRCLQLLRPAFEDRLDTVVTVCVRRSKNIQVSNSIKKELVARCIAYDLGLIDRQSRIQKPYLRSLIEASKTISEGDKAKFRAAVDSCSDFNSCLAKQCKVI